MMSIINVDKETVESCLQGNVKIFHKVLPRTSNEFCVPSGYVGQNYQWYFVSDKPITEREVEDKMFELYVSMGNVEEWDRNSFVVMLELDKHVVIQ